MIALLNAQRTYNITEMNKTIHWMLAAILTVGGAWALVSCSSTGGDQKVVESQQPDTIVIQPDTYVKAIEIFLNDSIGSHYATGDVCIPSVMIIGVDSTQTDDIKVWGDYWVYRYTVVGDTLKMMSGGNHPGLMHVRLAEGKYEVTSFDAVGDGSQFLPSARRIFGNKFQDFQTVQADEKNRELVRATGIAEHIKLTGIPVKYYQDADWPAVAISGTETAN